jgi:hypothetical protein
LSGNLTLPAGLTSIGSAAFYNCSGFTSVTNLSLVPQNISSSVFYNVGIENITLTVPSSAASLYRNADVWRDFQNVVGGGVLLSVKANNGAMYGVLETANGLYPADTTVGLIAAPAYSFFSWTGGDASLGATITAPQKE